MQPALCSTHVYMLSLLIVTGSGGGIEHCDGSSTGTVSVGQPHCDSVV